MGDMMGDVFHTTVGDDGRVVIPAVLRKQLGLTPGEQVVIEADGSGVRLRNWNRVLAEVQDYFKDVGPPGEYLSDELIKDRRAEAAREECE